MKKASSRHVALLRGINVGGKNMLPMKELAGMFAKARCSDVTTYIQSGNVVFCADDKVAAGVGAAVARQGGGRFGVGGPGGLRTAGGLCAVVRADPFLNPSS